MSKLLPVNVVKDRLACSSSYVYLLIETRELPAVKIGKKKGYRVKESALDEYIEKSALPA